MNFVKASSCDSKLMPILIICNDTNNIEDNKCSDSCAPFKCISTSDHLNYLNNAINLKNI